VQSTVHVSAQKEDENTFMSFDYIAGKK
jgi:hypothetical protein